MDTGFLKIGSDERVSKLLGALNTGKKYYAVVFDSATDEFLGMTSVRKMLRKRTDFSKMKVKSVTDSNTPVLSRDTTLMKAAELMFVSDSRALPVIEDGTVFGIVSADSIIHEAVERSPIATVKARDIASPDPIFLAQDEPLGKAISLMKKHSVKRVLAVDKAGRVSGVLSLQSVMEKYLSQSTGQSPDFISTIQTKEKVSVLDTPISGELSPATKTISPDKRIGSVLPDIESGYAVILTEKGRPVGVITRRDLLEAIVKTGAVERNIQVVDAPDLDEIDLAKVNSTINLSYDRVKKSLGLPYSLLVHFKQYKKAGSRVKHSVHIRASAPGFNLKAEADSWNVITSLQSALKELERGIRKQSSKGRPDKKSAAD